MVGRSACLVCGRMNLCSGIVVLLIRNTVIKMSAGFPSSSKMYGVLHLYMTGQISLLCRLCWLRHAVIAVLRITTLQKQ